jgi:carbon monoxide dehydrogenase subunit G
MKLEQSFTVTAPVEQVWAMLVNVERVAPCLPGAEITGQGPDGSYEGTFSVKLGPATAAYNGSLKMDSLDEASRTATMHANGTDKRGQGGAHAVIVSSLRQDGDETTVDVSTDFTITGRLARFGRGGMIEDISKRLMRDFAQCLQSTLAAEQEAGLVPGAAEPAAAAAAAASAEPGAAAEPAGGDEPPAAAEPPATGVAADEPHAAAEPPAAAAAADAPLSGQEAASADEPLQPAQAPWPPRAPEPEEAPPAEPPAAAAEEPAAPLPGAGAGEPAAAESPAPAPEEPAAPLPEGAAEEPPAAAEPPAPAPAAAAPRTGSIPPPTAAPRPAVQPAKPVKGFSLLFGVLWDRIKRFFGRLFGRKREN